MESNKDDRNQNDVTDMDDGNQSDVTNVNDGNQNYVTDKDDGNQNDVTDFWPFGKRKSKPVVTKPVQTVFLPSTIDSDEYFMNFPNRGKCYIFNHKTFSTKKEERKGTNVDARRLYCQFKMLGFETVTIFQDLKVEEVIQKIKEASEEDHSNNSCFVCCILTHGEYGMLHAKDGKYSTECVFAPFVGTLVGKPKLFFIQACQGNKVESGVKVVCNESTDDPKFRISSHADFLIMHSTVPGFCAWRNEVNGSWFIEALCDVLKKHAQNKDLLNMLTIVNRKVALNYESYNPEEPDKHMMKQVSYITSTLTRDVRFS